MKAISFGVLAAAALAMVALTAAPAQAGTCSYKSKDWVKKGVVSCTPGFAPIGFPGTRWKVAGPSNAGTPTAPAARNTQGYWAPCK